MKLSSAPEPSICGFARMPPRSPFSSGVAASRDSSMRACMQPLIRLPAASTDAMQIALLMTGSPRVLRECLWARQVCHVAASPLCDLECPNRFPIASEIERELRCSTRRWAEKMRGKFVLPLFRETEPPAREAKTLANQLRHGAGGVHAGPEVGVVVAFATHCTND